MHAEADGRTARGEEMDGWHQRVQNYPPVEARVLSLSAYTVEENQHFQEGHAPAHDRPPRECMSWCGQPPPNELRIYVLVLTDINE